MYRGFNYPCFNPHSDTITGQILGGRPGRIEKWIEGNSVEEKNWMVTNWSQKWKFKK